MSQNAQRKIDWLEDDLSHYRQLYRQYHFWLDHVLANRGLHAKETCSVCDLIRVRPTRAFTNAEDAKRYWEEMAAPRTGL